MIPLSLQKDKIRTWASLTPKKGHLSKALSQC